VGIVKLPLLACDPRFEFGNLHLVPDGVPLVPLRVSEPGLGSGRAGGLASGFCGGIRAPGLLGSLARLASLFLLKPGDLLLVPRNVPSVAL
jgi:hypothetical protein